MRLSEFVHRCRLSRLHTATWIDTVCQIKVKWVGLVIHEYCTKFEITHIVIISNYSISQI